MLVETGSRQAGLAATSSAFRRGRSRLTSAASHRTSAHRDRSPQMGRITTTEATPNRAADPSSISSEPDGDCFLLLSAAAANPAGPTNDARPRADISRPPRGELGATFPASFRRVIVTGDGGWRRIDQKDQRNACAPPHPHRRLHRLRISTASGVRPKNRLRLENGSFATTRFKGAAKRGKGVLDRH